MKTVKTKTVKIAVAVHGGWRQIDAQLVADLGLTPVALHRTINRQGWSLTSVACGFVICRGATKAKALAGYQHILTHRSPEEVLARIQSRPAAPVPDCLRAVEPTAVRPPVISSVDVADAIAARAGLTAEEREAVLRALGKAGAHSGKLRKKAPVGYTDPLGQAAWNGLQPNPYKVQTSSLLFARGPERALLDKLLAKNWPIWLDADADALVKLGVW
jgi:hypothetical protein